MASSYGIMIMQLDRQCLAWTNATRNLTAEWIALLREKEENGVPEKSP